MKKQIEDITKQEEEVRSDELLPRERIVRSHKFWLSKFAVVFVVLGIVAGVGYGVVTAVRVGSPTESEIIEAEQAKAKTQKEIEKVLAQAGRLFVLPQGEVPVMATVLDAEALKREQPFYANVIDGDHVLIYAQRQQAVIYSPERDIIVNVGPVQFQSQLEPTPGIAQAATGQTNSQANSTSIGTGNQQQTTQAVASTLETTLTVEVRNGNGVTGAAARLASELTQNPAYAVIGTTDAINNDYSETLLVDLTGNDQANDAISKLATLMGATVMTLLPEGEVESEAEALIIIGAE